MTGGTGADAAGALHDFNNAVQALSASVYCLGRRTAQNESADLGPIIAAMKDQVTRIGSLGAALARAASAGSRSEHDAIAVGGFIHAFARQLPALLPDAIRLEVRVDIDAAHVACDPARLESAIRNLVLNARDAMPAGGVLALRGHMAEPGSHPVPEGPGNHAPGRFVAITVADTGSGMDADLLHRCFEPFVTTKTTVGGTGLGLFQLRAFAMEMGGTVAMRSRKGHGTEATILLPCIDAMPS